MENEKGVGENVSLRQKLSRSFDSTDKNDNPFPWIIPTLAVSISIGVLCSILETEPSFTSEIKSWLEIIEMALIPIFSLEFCLRVWVEPEYHPNLSPHRARLRFVFSLLSMIDLIVIFTAIIPFFSSNISGLRVFRLFRILRIAKFARLTKAFEILSVAFENRKFELLASFLITMLSLLISATLLYLIEGKVQPEAFGSIPRSMWWAVVTLTTIGYGDIYPITIFGKFVGALVSIIGIGIIAIPTGIFAAGISDEIRKSR